MSEKWLENARLRPGSKGLPKMELSEISGVWLNISQDGSLFGRGV